MLGYEKCLDQGKSGWGHLHLVKGYFNLLTSLFSCSPPRFSNDEQQIIKTKTALSNHIANNPSGWVYLWNENIVLCSDITVSATGKATDWGRSAWAPSRRYTVEVDSSTAARCSRRTPQAKGLVLPPTWTIEGRGQDACPRRLLLPGYVLRGDNSPMGSDRKDLKPNKVNLKSKVNSFLLPELVHLSPVPDPAPQGKPGGQPGPRPGPAGPGPGPQRPGRGGLHHADGGCRVWPGGGDGAPPRPSQHQPWGEGSVGEHCLPLGCMGWQPAGGGATAGQGGRHSGGEQPGLHHADGGGGQEPYEAGRESRVEAAAGDSGGTSRHSAAIRQQLVALRRLPRPRIHPRRLLLPGLHGLKYILMIFKDERLDEFFFTQWQL